MINEFFYAAIKFVWRRNLYDKTLAVILLEKKLYFWLILLNVMEKRLPSSHCLLINLPRRNFHIFRFISFSYYSNLSSQINLIINFYHFAIIRARKRRRGNEADCKVLLFAHFSTLFPLSFMCWHRPNCFGSAWNNRDKSLMFHYN